MKLNVLNNVSLIEVYCKSHDNIAEILVAMSSMRIEVFMNCKLTSKRKIGCPFISPTKGCQVGLIWEKSSFSVEISEKYDLKTCRICPICGQSDIVGHLKCSVNFISMLSVAPEKHRGTVASLLYNYLSSFSHIYFLCGGHFHFCCAWIFCVLNLITKLLL